MEAYKRDNADQIKRSRHRLSKDEALIEQLLEEERAAVAASRPAPGTFSTGARVGGGAEAFMPLPAAEEAGQLYEYEAPRWECGGPQVPPTPALTSGPYAPRQVTH